MHALPLNASDLIATQQHVLACHPDDNRIKKRRQQLKSVRGLRIEEPRFADIVLENVVAAAPVLNDRSPS